MACARRDNRGQLFSQSQQRGPAPDRRSDVPITECLVPALLVERWFGPAFNLARLRHVLGLLAAAAFGSAAGSVCWIVASRLFYGPTGPILTTFQYWFLSDMIGFITLGPFVLGLFAAWRQPPPQREIMEGLAALLAKRRRDYAKRT